MANLFFYGGLGVILVAVVFALIAAIIGCKNQGWKTPEIFLASKLEGAPHKMPRNMKLLLTLAVITLVIGAILLGIGFEIALK